MTDERYKSYLADNLKELIYLTGKSQAETARSLKMNYKTLRSYIDGHDAPIDVLIKFSEYFDVPIDRLVKRDYEPIETEETIQRLYAQLDDEEKKLIIHYMKTMIDMRQK